MRLHIQINDDNLSLRRASFVKYTRYVSYEIQPSPQIQPNRKITHSNSSGLMDQIMLKPTTIRSPQQVSVRRIPTTHETLLSPLSKKHSTILEYHKLKHQLILLSGKKLINCESTSTRVKKYIQHIYNTFISTLFKKKKPKKKSAKIIRQEFAIQCMAKSEFIAAGKLHYILSDVSLYFLYT